MGVKSVDDIELQSLLNNNDTIVFIDFWAPWCGPCKLVEPVINELAEEFVDFEFVKINVDENPQSTALYGVRSIPTFAIIKNGELIFRHSGAVPKSFLREKISSILK